MVAMHIPNHSLACAEGVTATGPLQSDKQLPGDTSGVEKTQRDRCLAGADKHQLIFCFARVNTCPGRELVRLSVAVVSQLQALSQVSRLEITLTGSSIYAKLWGSS